MEIKSPLKAIKAKCKDCIYNPLAGGTWLMQIENCPATDCPLWNFRPLTKVTKDLIKENERRNDPEKQKLYEKRSKLAKERFAKQILDEHRLAVAKR